MDLPPLLQVHTLNPERDLGGEDTSSQVRPWGGGVVASRGSLFHASFVAGPHVLCGNVRVAGAPSSALPFCNALGVSALCETVAAGTGLWISG